MDNISQKRVLFFIVAFAIVFIAFAMRRPDIITNPQFWAEDGKVWYAQAYNLGVLNSILLPQDGYYQTISKLVAGISLNFSIASAPLVFNIAGLLIRSSLVIFILSRRMSCLDMATRCIVATFIVLMPHLQEVHANITNTHWYLATYLFFVLISDKSESILWRCHDYIVLVLSGLSGPFAIFLAPVILFRVLSSVKIDMSGAWIKQFFKSITLYEWCFALVCTVQLIAILMTQSSARSPAELGASIQTFSNIASSKIFIGFILSEHDAKILWSYELLNLVATTVGIAFLVYCFVKSDWRVKGMIVFPVLMLAAALAKPMISLTQPQWPQIQLGAGQRYFVITSIFWVLILSSAFRSFGRKVHIVYLIAFLSVALPSFYKNFNIGPFPDNRWDKQVVIYKDAKPGEYLRLSTALDAWKVAIKKK